MNFIGIFTKPCRFFCCLAIVVWLTGTASANDEARPKIYTVAFAQDTLANDWRKTQVEQLSRLLKQHANIRFVYTDGGGNSAQQISDIENFTYQNVDILITSPRDSIASTPAIARAYRQGIPVVLITRGITSDDYTTLIAPDDYAIASQAADFLAEQLKGKGRVLVLRGVPTATTAKARTQGFLDSLEKYPGISVTAIKDGNYLRSDAIRAIEEVLYEGTEFDAIYAQSDSMASGARLALRKAGMDPKKLLIIGIDYISEARKAIREGEQTASFLYPTCAEATAEAVLKLLHGKSVAKKITVDSQMITRDNVDRIAPIF